MKKTKSTLVSFSIASLLCLGGASAVSAPAKSKSAAKSIVTTASEAGTFKTLVAALKAADLVSALEGPGPFTVFAPTDEAFAKLPPGTVESLLKPENKAKLQSILEYHITSGKVSSATARTLSSAATLQGSTLSIVSSGGGLKVGNASVIKADIEASNGVIHVIDTVVLPPG